VIQHTLILGIGNILWADEGFGVRAVEELDRLYQFDQHVRLVEGGTQGIALLEYVEMADNLVIFDAIDFGLEPATLKLIEDDQVPNFMGAKKMSLHQTGFQEVLAMAQMLDRCPQRLLLVGVQPVVLEDYGGSLHPQTHAQIQPAIDSALNWLADNNVEATRRESPLSEPLAGAQINIRKYESERPDEHRACRVGDSRVLQSPDYELEYRPHPINSSGKIVCDVDHRGKYDD